MLLLLVLIVLLLLLVTVMVEIAASIVNITIAVAGMDARHIMVGFAGARARRWLPEPCGVQHFLARASMAAI